MSNSGVFSIKYPFVYNDIFLIAEVDKNSGKQWLIMQKIDPRTQRVLLEDRIQCIHTAITTIEVDEFEERVSEEDFEEEMLNIRSSGNLREVHLEPQEKIFAFKSWVAGIAKAGKISFKIPNDGYRYFNCRFCGHNDFRSSKIC